MRNAELTARADAVPLVGRGTLGLLAAAFVAVVGVAALDYYGSQSADVAVLPPLDPAELSPGFGPESFDAAMAAVNQDLEGRRYLLAREPDDWVRMEGVARALLTRARLTASAEDFHEAGRLLAAGIEAAPYPSGPVMSRAGAALAIHDLPVVERALERLDASVTPPNDGEAIQARAMRCEIAYERGDLKGAKALCAGGGGDDIGLLLRSANMELASGNTAAAARHVEEALRTPRQTPFQLARLMLQRSAIALATGDWEAAGEWARAADRIFPGYWLAQAFVAQSLALDGDVAGAEAAYRAIAERTDNPDVWGALVGIASERGDEAARRAYLARAGAAWERRVALLPDTYAGHYAEYLAQTGAIDRALAISGGDYAERPFLPVITGWAIVLDAAGRQREVLTVVERAEAAGFRSPTLLMFKSGALAALGRNGEAEEAREAALAMNPKIEHPLQSYVHFRQD
ncbi:tetratricopeptide repeat protein [Qipengyuania sp. MTN3-11]|uniref:tetratricopeptide repeat protein n=1 Tax=Qipengyuania sp. MTN3-11 TaxID=3056557 RepID=UPI0036F1DCFB